MARVIAVMNQKGGVGKTTTTVNLGAALSAISFKVLLIDLDPSGNMTQWLTGDYDAGQRGLSDLLGDRAVFEDISRKSNSLKVDFIPSGSNLSNVAGNGRVNLYTLKNKIGDFAENYDFIIIDCPPSSDFLVGNALLASDSVIIPIQTETLPLQAAIRFLDWLEGFMGRDGNSVRIMGILPCMYDSRTRLSRAILEAMKSSENIGPLVFETVIRKNIRLAELSGTDRSIFRSASTSFGASDYADLALEVIERSGMTVPSGIERQAGKLAVGGDKGSFFEDKNSDTDGGAELVLQDFGSGEYKPTETKEDD